MLRVAVKVVDVTCVKKLLGMPKTKSVRETQSLNISTKLINTGGPEVKSILADSN